MMIFKALFKIIARWLFTLLGAADETVEMSKNGNHRTLNKFETRGEQLVEDALDGLKRSIQHFENSLKDKAESLEECANGDSPARVMDDMRAEMAELKADMRVLKRILVERNGEAPVSKE